MSTYTDREHEKALSETMYWMKKAPVTVEEEYSYGEYQYSLKDYKDAATWYKKASEKGCISAVFKLAYCMRHNLGIKSNYEVEEQLFKQVIVHDSVEESVEAIYRLGMCYTYGYGIKMNEEKGIIYFQKVKKEKPEAFYEMGLFYKNGKGKKSIDKKKAEYCFYKAYDGFVEDAIFQIYDMFEGKFSEFSYIREIKEAYSFKLGRLMRVSELRPCREYLMRLADFYKKGYPGDTGDKLEKFYNLAQKYYKKASESNA